MNRAQLEHVIRAAASIADDREIVILGSQAILGRHPDAPMALCVSEDVDLYPRNHPDRSEVVDGAIGELSAFQALHLPLKPSSRAASSRTCDRRRRGIVMVFAFR